MLHSDSADSPLEQFTQDLIGISAAYCQRPRFIGVRRSDNLKRYFLLVAPHPCHFFPIRKLVTIHSLVGVGRGRRPAVDPISIQRVPSRTPKIHPRAKIGNAQQRWPPLLRRRRCLIRLLHPHVYVKLPCPGSPILAAAACGAGFLQVPRGAPGRAAEPAEAL